MTKTFNYTISLILISIGIVIGAVATAFVMYLAPLDDVIPALKSNEEKEMERILQILRDKAYFYESDKQLMEGGLTGIADALNDPYTVYFNEKDSIEFNNQLQAHFAGVGISIFPNGLYPIITNVMEGRPADLAGIKTGDTIISVDNIDLKGKTYEEVVDIIRGPEGTERTFIVAREDMDNHLPPIKVTLKNLSVNTVKYKVIEENNEKIGYINITQFAAPTYNEFTSAMVVLEEANIESLIVDVRGNPGGYLHIVKAILDYFIESKYPFLYQEYRDKSRTSDYLQDGKSLEKYNIVILIDENSASASEVFAATMNEMKGYQLLGKTTFGKGLVQVTEYLNEDKTKSVKYTTSKWLTSKEKYIHDIGVNPTIEVELSNFNGLSYIDPLVDILEDTVNQENKEMQLLLNRLGYETRTDGYFNVDTTLAVKAFQEDYMGTDKATGFVTDETVYYMNLELLEYFRNLENDNQYKAAVNYLLQN